ncbi:MAG TPA: thioredoxin family protein, partial [Chitinophagaceae bacterium]|nr:thioredoxin family protein [Chitinophagaceae bacterium]
AVATFAFAFISYFSVSQININLTTFTNDCDTMLLYRCTFSAFQQQPFANWFNYNADTAHIDSVTALQLKKALKNTTLEIFMGSWCGDSKREIPQLYKLLQYIHYPERKIKLILVDDETDRYKQSPEHEEQGKNIFRVPCVIVVKDKQEVGRVIEYPIESWAKDLYKIASKENYTPHYSAGLNFMQLLNEKGVAGLQKDSAAMIAEIKQKSAGRSELNAIGYVYNALPDTSKALFTFLINYAMYPKEPRVINSLAFMYRKVGNSKKAKELYNKTLSIDAENEAAKEALRSISAIE